MVYREGKSELELKAQECHHLFRPENIGSKSLWTDLKRLVAEIIQYGNYSELNHHNLVDEDRKLCIKYFSKGDTLIQISSQSNKPNHDCSLNRGFSVTTALSAKEEIDELTNYVEDILSKQVQIL